VTSDRKRLIKIALEEDRAIRRSEEVEHEPAVAVFYLLAENVLIWWRRRPVPIAC
jgi:uncharacterized protein (UPF0262 family)